MLPAAVHGGDLLLGRSSAVGQDAEGGSGFIGLWQESVGSGPLEEEAFEWGWMDEGSQSTSVASQGSTALLLGSQRDPGATSQFFWLPLGLGPHGTLEGRWQQVSSLLSSARSNLLILFLSRSLHTPRRRFW